MSYFVTGATGFIGRHLVEELLDHREGTIFALVRQGSLPRLETMIELWEHRPGGAGDRRPRRRPPRRRRGVDQ